jgi:hypothetical protein
MRASVFRISFAAALLGWAATSCGDRCGGENLNTLTAPEAIESFEISDSKGQTLWKITTTTPAPVTFLRYGDVPAGFQQVVPSGSARPRPFVKGETLHERTLTKNWFFNHEGIATSESSFCGGYYENGPRKDR